VESTGRAPDRGVDGGLAIDDYVRGGHVEAHDLVGEEAAVVHPERIEHQLTHYLLVGRFGHNLDDAASKHEGGVVVGEHLARRRLLR
jgi:hypothetical protein